MLHNLDRIWCNQREIVFKDTNNWSLSLSLSLSRVRISGSLYTLIYHDIGTLYGVWNTLAPCRSASCTEGNWTYCIMFIITGNSQFDKNDKIWQSLTKMSWCRFFHVFILHANQLFTMKHIYMHRKHYWPNLRSHIAFQRYNGWWNG